MRFNYPSSVLYFTIPMGLLGVSLNAQHLTEQLSLHNNVSLWILFYGWISFFVISAHYVLHFLGQHRTHLLQEWNHPSQCSLFPAITLTILLFILSLQVFVSPQSSAHRWLEVGYFLAVGLHLLLNWNLLTRWMFQDDITINHKQPSWFILLSGNFFIVIAGVHIIDLSWLPIWYEVLWLFFSATLLLWLSFTVSLFYRLMFEKPLLTHQRPSLFIFLAPPSLAVIASILLMQVNATTSIANQPLSPLTWVLYSFATVMFLLWLTLIRFFYNSGLSSNAWAYVYPLAAYGLATQYIAQALGSTFLLVFSVFILIVLIALIGLLSVWLVKQALRN